METSASEVAFSDSDWSIPTFRADFFRFASKIAQISPYLLPAKHGAEVEELRRKIGEMLRTEQERQGA
jgi:hypothetical protein